MPKKRPGKILRSTYNIFSETYEYISKGLQNSLTNIYKAMIRNEYKCSIYNGYLLPAMRFKLTVHDINNTD